MGPRAPRIAGSAGSVVTPLESEECFQLDMQPSSGGHKYKLCKKLCASQVRAAFCTRVELGRYPCGF